MILHHRGRAVGTRGVTVAAAISGLLAVFMLTAGALASPASRTSPAPGEPERFECSRIAMGTKARVVAWAGDREEARRAAEAALDRLTELDAILSDWSATSELSRFVAKAGSGEVTLSPDLASALEQAQRFALLTDGAFDPTVGPVVRLWRASRAAGTSPDPAALDEARSRIGWRRLSVDRSRAVAALEAGTLIDLGAIGKGIAADEMLATLRAAGIESVLVDVGGSIRLGAAPPGRADWSVAATVDGARYDTILASDVGIATSGDLEQVSIVDGVRLSHIIDPRTGEPLKEAPSVTVIAPDATTADALSTALSVLGVAEGRALVESLGAAALVTGPAFSGIGATSVALGALPAGCTWPAFETARAANAREHVHEHADGDDVKEGLGDPIVEQAPEREQLGMDSFVRARRGGEALALEIATWTMRPVVGEGPTIRLVGVTHVAEQAYYEDLAARLAEEDVVLFESVMPRAAWPPAGANPEAQAAATRASLELIASLEADVRGATGVAPQSLAAMAEAMAAIDSRFPAVIHALAIDAWGHPIEFQPVTPVATDGSNGEAAAPRWLVRSLGADGRQGGTGADADIEVAARSASKNEPLDLQRELAHALGLAHQVESVDYNHPGWILADLSIESVRDGLEARGVDAGQLLDTIGGSSFPAFVARALLRIVRFADRLLGGQAAALMRVMIIEMLAGVDTDTFAAAGLGPGFEEVIINDRNQSVVDVLRGVLERDPPPSRIAILYGAAHMPDLAARIESQLGYRMEGAAWHEAISVRFDETGLRPQDIAAVRRMVRTTLDSARPRPRRPAAQAAPESAKGAVGESGTAPASGAKDLEPPAQP